MSDNETKQHIGFLLVANGLATNEQVFPNGAPPTPTDLYRVPKSTVSSRHWYNPLSWFRRGASSLSSPGSSSLGSPLHEASSLRPAAAAASSSSSDSAPDGLNRSKSGSTSEQPPHPQQQSALPLTNDESATGQALSTPPPPPPAAAVPQNQAQQQKGASPSPAAAAAVPVTNPNPKIPTLDQRPLNRDEVDGLTPSVRAERRKLLGYEESIHVGLNNIERTRLTFLVPAALQCETPVLAVQHCYQTMEQRRVAAAKGKWRATYKPSDVLECGAVVEALRKCVEDDVLREK